MINNYISNDLLVVKDEFIYLRVLFSEKGNKIWKLGKLFSLKYKFVFNPETKQVGFYLKQSSPNNTKQEIKIISDKEKYSNNNMFFKIFFIIILIIFFSFLGIKYYKIICNFGRHKRKNEILINDYKYDSNNNEKEMMTLNNNND